MNALLAAAWLLSTAPLALRALSGVELGETSNTFAVLLPWIALAGLPRPARHASRPAGSRPSHERSTWILVGLPPVVLAARLDTLADGLAAALPRAAAGWALASLLLLGATAPRDPRGRARHALLWFGLVVLPCLAAAILPWSSPEVARAPAWIVRLGQASPLGWWWRSGARGAPGVAGMLAPVAVAAALWAVAHGRGPAREPD